MAGNVWFFHLFFNYFILFKGNNWNSLKNLPQLFFSHEQYFRFRCVFINSRHFLPVFFPIVVGGRGIGFPLFISNTNANKLHTPCSHEHTQFVSASVCAFPLGTRMLILVAPVVAVNVVVVVVAFAFACIWKLKLLTIVIFFALLLLSLCCQRCYRGCCGTQPNRPHPLRSLATPCCRCRCHTQLTAFWLPCIRPNRARC